MISLHTFMFPFRWDYIAENKAKEKIPYSKRTRLSDFDRVFSACNTLKRTQYMIGDNRAKYNGYTYFHTFVRKALFYTGEYALDKHTVLYYELDGLEDDKFHIDIKGIQTYSLDFESVCLHIYNTGVGVLTFNLENNDYKEKEHILRINEFGRRIYPQFLGEDGVASTQNVFLAQSIRGSLANKIVFEEDFRQYNGKINTKSTFLAPDFIKKIFGYRGQEREGDGNVPFVFSRPHEAKGKIRISQVTDDRMFFVSYYENGGLANELALKDDKGNYKYLLDNFWYGFLFGDKDMKDVTIKNDEMQIEHVKHHSYSRWIDYKQKNGLNGSLFGMTRDSFVCIGGFFMLPIHMKTMYYQMSVLCLVQRASVLRFAYEVSNITELLNENGNITPRIKDLYKNYIEFINKIYFREVTPQIQGIEMYNQFQQAMNLKQEVENLDGEIQELHTYVSMDEQDKLSKVAIWFLPAGVVIGLMGINAFTNMDFDITFTFSAKAWWLLIGIGLSLGISRFIFWWLNRGRYK